MTIQSRGHRRPRIAPEGAAGVPPGQFPTERWPVLHYGEIPPFDAETWDLQVIGLVERQLRLSWVELLGLPRTSVTGDLHCVTRWSKLGNVWEGVSFRLIMDETGARPEARFVLFHCDGGYTANLPIEAVAGEDALLALKHDGADLTPEHGFPVRLVVPSRYAWKSAKWVRRIEFLATDRAGFWEEHGYHMNADFWKEERFAE